MLDLISAIEFSRDRASCYRLLAQLYFRPLNSKQIEALASMDIKALSQDTSSLFAEGYNDLYQSLRLRHSGTHEELAADYTGVFYGIRTFHGRTAQPFQSLYQSSMGSLMGEARSVVYRQFKSEALRVPDGTDLPEDHLSFLFEYMALLCDKTVDALHEGDMDRAVCLIERQRSFFNEHILSWLSDFIALAEQLVETRFYRSVLKLTCCFADGELATINEIADSLG